MIIRLVDCPSQPWKNGFGRTRELAIEPASAGVGEFVWRVSVAEVDSAAPFSVFPGIDRHIVLLDGNGFTMKLDGRAQHALTTPFIPFGFPGETKVDVTLTDGPTRDFNLMVRRDRARGDLLAWHGPATHRADPTLMLVFCARGIIDTTEGRLRTGDAWRPSSRDAVVTLLDRAVALAVVVEPGGA